jgi:hypothetical protein
VICGWLELPGLVRVVSLDRTVTLNQLGEHVCVTTLAPSGATGAQNSTQTHAQPRYDYGRPVRSSTFNSVTPFCCTVTLRRWVR